MRRAHIHFAHITRFIPAVLLALTIGFGVSDLANQHGIGQARGTARPDMYPDELNPRNPCQCW
jgi:hypothetical protein